MKNIIKDYCLNEDIKNGLILMDMPTGSGKTHSVLDFIYEYVVSGGDKKIFFITTLLKNLPEDELKRRFEKNGKLALFKDKFLRIESNADSVCHFFASEDKEVIKHKNNIPSGIQQSDEYKKLRRDVELINNSKSLNDSDVREMVAHIRTEMQQKSERNFRYYLERKLSDICKTAEQRKEMILSDDNWKWVADMYPAILTKDKQIIFLSISKFIVRNNTIIEPSYLFYNNDIINGAFIFIDEFDATKETILGNIIDNGISGKIDTLELFRDIYNALNDNIRTFPAALTVESEYSKKRREKYNYDNRYSPEEIIESFRTMADDLFALYNFDLSFKTEQINDENQCKFLFHDHRFHSISGGSARIRKDDSDKLNYIHFDKKIDEKEKSSVSGMLGRVRGFLSYFQTGIKLLAVNYQNLKNERKSKDEDTFTLEFSIKSILHEFHLKDNQIDYLTSAIMDGQKNTSVGSSPYDLSLYERGFRLYDFVDDSEHDMQSVIMMENFQLTPEKILLCVCERAKVIGISATATIPSVIGNYDIDYLRLRLGENFHIIDDEQTSALKRQFDEATSNYDKVNIIAEPVNPEANGEYSAESWKQVIDNDDVAEELFNIVAQASSPNNYNEKRY